MYTTPPPTPEYELQAPKTLTAAIAQRLYEHFSQMRLNMGEWLTCLEQFLIETEEMSGAHVSLGEVKNRIREIITEDKAIPLERLSEGNRQEINREVAEWLVAEKICEKMVTYEQSISEGLKNGTYKPIHEIEEVMVIKDDDVFHGSSTYSPDEIKKFIMENYVVKAKGEPLGKGARVEVRELAPIKFPLPYPTRDERKEGLMILIPNRFLVIRILRDSYRDSLGEKIDKSELNAINAFKLASELLVFTGRETGAITEISEDTATEIGNSLPEDARPAKAARRTIKHSFIPPLIIIKAILDPGSLAQYLTIQKKVARKGHIGPRNTDMIDDLAKIKGFKKRVREFIAACKRFHRKEKMLPDTVGGGNVLYTARGNVYLVDINNITAEPDFEFVALVLHYKKIFYTMEFSSDEKRKKVYRETLSSLETEIKEKIASGDPRRELNWNEIMEVVENIHSKNDNPAVQKFLHLTGIIDDLGVTVFLHNMVNLRSIEETLLFHELKEKTITDEEYRKKSDSLSEEHIYRPISSQRGIWRGKNNFDLRDTIRNKQEGHDNWIADYIQSLYGTLNSTAGMA